MLKISEIVLFVKWLAAEAVAASHSYLQSKEPLARLGAFQVAELACQIQYKQSNEKKYISI